MLVKPPCNDTTEMNGIVTVSDEMRSVFKLVGLADRALATSGDYRSYYDKDGVRFSHLIDPRSGRPIAHDLTSVSVVHTSAAKADALATGLGVLGPKVGHTIAERQGLAAYFIVRLPDGGLRGIPTTAFESLEARETLDPTS